MKILVIGAGSPVPTFIYRRLKKLDSSNIKLLVSCTSFKQFEDFSNAEQVKYFKLKQKPLHALICIFYLLKNIKQGIKLLKLAPFKNKLSKFRWVLEQAPLLGLGNIDIIHLQWIGMASNYKWLKEIYNVPIIASARGSQVTVYPYQNPQKMIYIKKCIEDVDYIHAVSKDIADVCVNLGAKESKIILNYNGIDHLQWIPKPKTINNIPKIISVGALMWRKGYLHQLLAAKKLKQSGNEFEWYIIGSGQDMVGLRYTIKLLNLEENVFILGQLNSQIILEHLQNSDIYVSTSAAEGLPNSVVEATACGLPVVAFQCEGINEIVRNEISGYVIPFGEIDNLVGKLQYFISNEDIRNKFGEEARKNIENNFREEFWVKSMINSYHEITKRK